MRQRCWYRSPKGVAGLGRCELDHRFSLITAHELAQRAPAAAGGVAAHDEADAACVEQVDQPGRRAAAAKQQQVVGAEFVQRMGQHGALGLAARVHGGMQGALSAWRSSANRR